MSNLGARVLVAAVAIPLIVLLAWLGGYFWFLFVAAVLVFSMLEFSELCRAKGMYPQTTLMLASGIAMLLVFLHERLAQDLSMLLGTALPTPLQWQAMLWVILLTALTVPAVELFRRKGSALQNIGATFLGFLYLGMFLATVVGIREIFSIAEFPVGRFFGTALPTPEMEQQLHAWGGYTMISVLATIWICDTAAYFGGRAMGRHRLFERVSPKKTWEGAFWGLASSLATMLLARQTVLDYLTVTEALAIGAFIGTIGQLGDLVESLLKRDASVKDSSSMLPGHGGVLDRFDSLVFVSPVIFLFLDFVVFY